jgi:hypothetical protein
MSKVDFLLSWLDEALHEAELSLWAEQAGLQHLNSQRDEPGAARGAGCTPARPDKVQN